jgi:hypothetical protein
VSLLISARRFSTKKARPGSQAATVYIGYLLLSNTNYIVQQFGYGDAVRVRYAVCGRVRRVLFDNGRNK